MLEVRVLPLLFLFIGKLKNRMPKPQTDQIGQRIGLLVLLFFVIFLGLLVGYWYSRARSHISNMSEHSEMEERMESHEEEKGSNWSAKDKERLAKFLAEKGVVLYYGNTCPHCHRQFELFGEARKYLKKIDCYQSENTETCNRAQIEGVPTWKWGSQTKVGVQSLDELADWVGFKR